MKNLIIFSGAGSSTSVSSESYPTAKEFKARLPEPIKSNQLFIYLDSYLESILGVGNVDIEHILWELKNLNDVTDLATSNKTFFNHFLRKNQVESVTGLSPSGQSIHSQFKELNRLVKLLKDEINKQVYNFYSQDPDTKDLKRTWFPLLKMVRKSSFNKINIFTTNYDLIIENALQEFGFDEVSEGYTHGYKPSINLKAWDDASASLLTKLHGSVDWKLGGTELKPIVRRGLPEFEGDHDKRLIVYPGFKGVPEKELFITYHNYFKDQLSEASHILFIGFAFRDEYINQLIKDSYKKTTKLAIIDPCSQLPEQSFLSNAKHFRNSFSFRSSANTPTVLSEAVGLSSILESDLVTWLD